MYKILIQFAGMKLFCSLFWYRNFYCSPKTLWWNIKLFLRTYFNYIEVKLLSRFSLFFLFFKVTPFSRVADQNRGIFVGSMVQHFKQVRIHQTRVFFAKILWWSKWKWKRGKVAEITLPHKADTEEDPGLWIWIKMLAKKMDPDENKKKSEQEGHLDPN